MKKLEAKTRLAAKTRLEGMTPLEGMTLNESIEAADKAVEDCVVTTVYSTVPPDQAQHWLNKNLRNRRLSRARVDRYKGIMLLGQWEDNGDSCLCFDKDGNLLNGQHRLTSIVELGLAIAMRISYGVDPGCFATFDAGLNRTRGNSIKLAFPEWTTTKAVSLSAALVKENALRFGSVTLSNIKQADICSTSAGAIDMLEKDSSYSEIYDGLRDVFCESDVALFFGWGILNFIARRIYAIDEATSREWLYGLITGQGLIGKDARLTLRRWFITMRVNKTLLSSNERIFVILKAWDAAVNKDNYTLSKAAISKRGRDPLACIRFPSDIKPSKDQITRQWDLDKKAARVKG